MQNFTRRSADTPAGRGARCLYSGTAERPIYADIVAAAPDVTRRHPVVMVHGGCHTGACYIASPDGREGWAGRFAREGHDVYAVDWPGHGRSPACADLPKLSTREIAQSIRVLLEAIGPAVLLVHSASGPMAWWIAETAPSCVAAVIGIAPGAPANILPVLPNDPDAVAKLRDDESLGCPVMMPEDRPVVVGEAFIQAYWANSPRFPAQAFQQYAHSVVPESARLFNERFNIGGQGLAIRDPANLAMPKLIVTGDLDLRHPRAVDEATAQYIGAEFIWLPDRSIHGNGHMTMIEDNSDEIAGLLLDWLHDKGL
jgi:pimeloyl-ACP methyl ester carboxylesterase